MPNFNNFPYTNFHEVNLDWVLEQIKNVNGNLEEIAKNLTIGYKGEYNESYRYPKFSLVSHNNNLYIAIDDIEPFTDINDSSKWLLAISGGNSADLGNKIVKIEKDITEIKKYLIAHDKVIIVGKNEKFTTINSAITFCKEQGVSLANPYDILIMPDVYTEQIVLTKVNGISFVGIDRENTIIQYNGQYPDCVVHVDSNLIFKNLTIKGLNNSVYAIHIDTQKLKIPTKIFFENCIIIGGTSALGYGSGENTLVSINNCKLSSAGDSVLYVHNSPYAEINQDFICRNTYFELRSDTQKFILIDDAGASNSNDGNSRMLIHFSNNNCKLIGKDAFAKMAFRKNTNNPSNDKGYLPPDDKNFIFNYSSDNNSGMLGLNYKDARQIISTFVLMPINPDTDGFYEIAFFAPNYNFTHYNFSLINVTIPGVGDITSQCSFGSLLNGHFSVKTKNRNVSGKSIAVTVSFSVKK